MFSKNTVLAAALMVGSVFAQPPYTNDNTPWMVGYKARTDVSADLTNDTIQKEYETIMKSENCEDFKLGCDFYNDPTGDYFRSIPTYKDEVSDEWNEFIQFANGDDEWHLKWIQTACNKDDANPNLSIGRVKVNFKSCFNINGKCFLEPGDEPGDKPCFGTKPDGKDVEPTGGACVGYEEMTKKLTSYVFNKIEIYQLMQQALDEITKNGCKGQPTLVNNLQNTDYVGIPMACDAASNAWDRAVAVFTGSLEGVDGQEAPGICSQGGTGNYGVSIMSLAGKRCDDFGTCGVNSDNFDKEDTSYAALITLQLFSEGQYAVWAGNAFDAAIVKRKIAGKLLIAPLQGTLRYYWRLSTSGYKSKADKYIGEAGSFAAGTLPSLWACSNKAFNKADKEMRLGGAKACKGKVNFNNVKLAFECNYQCLGISCKEMGGLYDGDNCAFNEESPFEYLGLVEPPIARNKAGPCDDVKNNSSPGQIVRCKKQNAQRFNQCKKYVGSPGIDSRDEPDYFIVGLQ